MMTSFIGYWLTRDQPRMKPTSRQNDGALPAPRARVVGITSPPSGFLDQHGRPGHSATGEYRRRRAADWQTWKPTITLRIAAVLTASVCVGLLTAAVAISSLAWFTGLIAAAALAWRLRFRPTADTLAWRRGANGEQRTARLLAPLERHGWVVLHDLAVPGSRANVDCDDSGRGGRGEV